MDNTVLQELHELRGVVGRAIDRTDGILKRDDNFELQSIRAVLLAQFLRIGLLMDSPEPEPWRRARRRGHRRGRRTRRAARAPAGPRAARRSRR